MPEFRISNIGETGLVTDRMAAELPPTAQTSMVNVTADRGRLRSVAGEPKLFDLKIGSTWYRPLYSTVFVDSFGSDWLVVSDGQKIAAFAKDGTGEDITPADTTQWDGTRVSFVAHNGILVVNHRAAGPYYWGNTGTKLQALPGWDAGWRCENVASYRYNLVALGMEEDGTRYPYKVRWSNSAAEGELPTEWVAAASNDAGDDLIGEDTGFIFGAALVRGDLWIVKDTAVYAMTYVGQPFIMSIRRLTNSVGTKLSHGFAEVRGSLIVMTGSDLLLFDGAQPKSLAEGRVRYTIDNDLGRPEYNAKDRLFFHNASNTVFLMGAADDEVYRDALMYNLEYGTWGHRQLRDVYAMHEMNVQIAQGEGDWEHETVMEWDDETEFAWDSGLYASARPDVIVLESNAERTEFWAAAVVSFFGVNSAGESRRCEVERLAIPIEGAERTAMVTEVIAELYPRYGEFQGTIAMQVVAQDAVDGPQQVSDWIPVVPQGRQILDVRVTGRYIGWRLFSEGKGNWSLGSLTIRWNPAGER